MPRSESVSLFELHFHPILLALIPYYRINYVYCIRCSLGIDCVAGYKHCVAQFPSQIFVPFISIYLNSHVASVVGT